MAFCNGEKLSGWKQKLFDIGDTKTCLLSFCCPCYAIAVAKSNVDGSACVLNYCCINPILSRSIIKSAYNIGGDPVLDCIVSVLCFPCVANQTLQSSNVMGNPSSDGGRDHLTENWIYSNCNCTGMSTSICFYSCCCPPCATASALKASVGTPFIVGLCCASPLSARHIIRYQYRIR